MPARFERGEVYWFDFRGSEGSEADDLRPVILLQTDWIQGLNTVLAVPCTTEMRRMEQPTGIFISKVESGLPSDSVAVCHLLTALDKSRESGKGPIGRVSGRTLHRILFVVMELLGIDAETFME